jgi:surfactin synthase thioesterase subunit
VNKKLYIFPHAGGLAANYAEFKINISGDIDVCPVEYAGRGTRYMEEPYHCFEEVIEDAYRYIVSTADNEEYYIFGHSMGGLLTYELCLKLEDNYKRPPRHIFISSADPPRYKPEMIYENISKEELLRELIKGGGIPGQVLESKGAIDFFLPVIISDITILQRFIPSGRRVNTNMSVLWGKEDKKAGIMKEWLPMTAAGCELKEFEGEHFYFKNRVKQLSDYINSCIGRYL